MAKYAQLEARQAGSTRILLERRVTCSQVRAACGRMRSVPHDLARFELAVYHFSWITKTLSRALHIRLHVQASKLRASSSRLELLHSHDVAVVQGRSLLCMLK